MLEQNSNETAAIYEPHCTYLIFGAQTHIRFQLLHGILFLANYIHFN